MRLDADCDARDTAVEGAAGQVPGRGVAAEGFFIARLVTLGESAPRIATLSSVAPREVRRLKDLLSPRWTREATVVRRR